MHRDSVSTHQTVLTVLLVIGAFLLGSIWTKLQILEKGQVGGITQAVVTPAPTGVQAQPQTITIDKIKDVFKKDIIKFGDVGAKVLFIEVADPSCPYCHVAAGKNGALNKQVGERFTLVSDGGSYIAPVPEMKKLLDEKKAAFAYIYYPGHGNGEMGTKALYCAYQSGKFWEVHDLLMTKEGYDLLNTTVRNDTSKSGQLSDFLKSVFDTSTMKACLDSGKYDSRISEDTKLAASLNVTGTPGFFVNATNFAGAYSYKDMEQAVNTALNK